MTQPVVQPLETRPGAPKAPWEMTQPVKFKGRTLYLGKGESSGIDVTYLPRDRMLHIGGGYDTVVGIRGGEVSLFGFLRGLGVTQEDVRACWTNWRVP